MSSLLHVDLMFRYEYKCTDYKRQECKVRNICAACCVFLLFVTSSPFLGGFQKHTFPLDDIRCMYRLFELQCSKELLFQLCHFRTYGRTNATVSATTASSGSSPRRPSSTRAIPSPRATCPSQAQPQVTPCN